MAAAPVPLRAVHEGHRNNILFRALLRHAHACDDFEQLLDVAQTIASEFDPPLPEAEVAKTAHSAWKYQQERRNWVGTEPRAIISASQIRALTAQLGGGDALLVLLVLKLAHGARVARGESFAASPAAMARARVIRSWGSSEQRYRRALRLLVECGHLEIVHDGGDRPGDARKFCFANGRAVLDPPRLIVTSSPGGADPATHDADLERVVQALRRGLSIRKAGNELGIEPTRVFRLKQRAVSLGMI